MPTLSQRLLGDRIPHPSSSVAQALKRDGVQDGEELQRVVRLPRRPADPKMFPDLTPVFAKPDGKLSLWPIQSWALIEAEAMNGLFAPLGVGSGKTLLTATLPDVLHSERTVLLIPPQLRSQFLNRDLPFYSKHFHILADKISVVAYSELSSPKKADILDRLKPDLIIADECHQLRERSSARTKRFLRYMEEHPETRFCGLSGTVTRRSIKDFAHLIQLALRQGSPLPFGFRELQDWAAAIDVSQEPKPMGALRALVTPEDGADPIEAVRKGFRRRLIETPGVVSTEESALAMSLIIKAQSPKIPSHIVEKLQETRATSLIEDEYLEDPIAMARVCRQLACGFYYRWVWPNGIKDKEWLKARANWHQEVAAILKYSKKGLDSPLLVAQAAAARRIETKHWATWTKFKDQPQPPTEAVWLDDFLINDAIQWGRETCTKETPGIIWYEHDTVGLRLAEKSKFPLFGGGPQASKDLSTIDAQRNPVIICSIKAHGTGKNLQMYNRSLITTPPASGLAFEQLLGRLHRPGQEADEVWFDVYLHTQETQNAFAQAIVDARYIESTQGQKQKLLYATRIMK